MNYNELAVWLTNHSQFVGADHQEDINKLKGTYIIHDIVHASLSCLLIIIGAKINGRAFFSLNENRLERSGVSLGFQCTLMDVIEDLVCAFMQNNNMNNLQNNDLAMFLYTYIYMYMCRRGASSLSITERHHHHHNSLQQVACM